MTSKGRTLYIGMTNNLARRVYEHRNKLVEGFTKRYNLTQLVYYEHTNDVVAAIEREKALKGWTRARKFDWLARSIRLGGIWVMKLWGREMGRGMPEVFASDAHPGILRFAQNDNCWVV